jgi:hypothetical protein
MSKPILGLILGGLLGILDGLSSLLSAGQEPTVRERIVEIVVGSTFKGLVAGIVTGYFAKKYRSLPVGIVFGLGVGMALATVVAVMEGGYYLEIILPGSIMGAIVGFATQKYGGKPARPSGA